MTGRVMVKGVAVGYESTLERDYLIFMNWHRGVSHVDGQPVTIRYRNAEGRMTSYTPDFLTTYLDGSRQLAEVKYRADLKELWADYRPRFRQGVRWAASQSAGGQATRFKIMTDTEIRTDYLRNARFLSGYIGDDPEPGIEDQLAATLVTMGETTPKALLEAAFRHPVNRVAAIRPMWRMIGLGRIEFDMNAALTMASAIWIIAGEGFVPPGYHGYDLGGTP